MPTAVISLAASGTPIAAPGAGKALHILSFMIQFDDTTPGTNTVILKSGTTALTGALIKSCTVRLLEGIFCGKNEAFVLTLSGSFACVGYVEYAIIG